MNLRNLLSVFLLTTAAGSFGRDIHGVNGYWNFTASQMKAESFIRVDEKTGNKDANFLPAVNFENGYMNCVLGVGTPETNWWRTTAYFNYQAKEANITITKDYPIVMFKFSLPKNGVIEGDVSKNSSLTIEHWWKSPYDGNTTVMTNVEGMGINGLNSSGRLEYMTLYPGFKDSDADCKLYGRDSVKIGWETNHTKYSSWGDEGLVYCSRTTRINDATIPTFICAVLPSTNSDRCEYIGLMNYGAIPDTMLVEHGGAASGRLLDRTNIESIGFHIMFFANKTIEGCEEAPYASIKWIKTFTDYETAMNSLTAANNWGDGVESALKTQLNYALYYAEQDLDGFIWRNSDPSSLDDEAYKAYKEAYEKANSVYNDPNASDADYEAAIAELQEARTTLLSEADLPAGRIYNYIKSATGTGSIVVGSENITVGNTTGRALTIGPNDAASAFSFVNTGIKVNGQNSYRLTGEAGDVVQAADGTLMVVPDVTGSSFTFAERDTEANGFDIKCGEYY